MPMSLSSRSNKLVLSCAIFGLILAAPSVSCATSPEATAAPIVAPNEITPPTTPGDEKLTDEKIRKFYALGKELHLKPYPDYEAFMKAHTRDDVQFTMNVTTRVPGKPDYKQTVVLDKDKFFASLPENYKISQGAKFTHEIGSIYIGEDGKTAHVKDLTTMSNTINVPQGRQAVPVDIQSQTTCEDIVKLGPGGIVQMQQSRCESENYFFPKK